MRQGKALAGGAGGQDDRRGRGRLAEAHGLDLRLHELHRVVDGGHRRVGATRGVDVDLDVAIRIHRLEAQQLRHDIVSRGIVDLDAEEDDALLEQLRVGVVHPLAVRVALAELGQDVAALRIEERHCLSPLPLFGPLAGGASVELLYT